MSFLVIVHVPYEPIPEKFLEETKKEDETILETKSETGENTDNEKSGAESDDEGSCSDEETTSDTSGSTEFEAWDLSDTEDYKSAQSTVDLKPAQSMVTGSPEVRESSTDPSQSALQATSSSTHSVARKKKTFGVTRVPSQEQHDKAVDEERKKRKKKKKQKKQEKITEEKRPSQGSVDVKSLKSDTDSAKLGVKTDDSKVSKVGSEDLIRTTRAKRSREGSLKVENSKQPMKGSLEHLFAKPSTEDKVLLKEMPRSSSCGRDLSARSSSCGRDLSGADVSKQTTSDKAKDKRPVKGSLDHLFSQPPQPASEEEKLLGSKSRSTSCDSEPDGIKQTTSDKTCGEKSLTDINDNSKTELVKEKDGDGEEEKEGAKDADDYTLEQEDEEEHELEATEDTPLTPLFEKIPIHKRVEIELDKMEVEAVEIEIVGHGEFSKISFIQDDSHKCEKILNRLRGIGVGITAGSSISVFPSSLHERGAVESDSRAPSADDDAHVRRKSEALAEKKSEFKKSVKSRLLVAQVVKSVKANAEFTFDYLLLLLLAGLIACLGLVENSSVVLVASMLISPLMGPILAATFGQVIRKKDLRDLGLKSEIKGLLLCLLVGFTFGLIAGGVGLHGAVWGSTDTWPTSEMKSRGMLRSLWVGVLIALPSGAGVAISVLGGNSGSLVGVAISASLLPPACNAGMLWAYALLSAISVPPVESVSPTASSLSSNITNTTTTSPTTVLPLQTGDLGCPPLVNNKYEPEYFCNISHDAALLGLVSLFLTIVNICCIIIMGVIVLKIKEVAPKTAGVDTFWREDVQVARGYYSTAKGATSKNLGKTFLEEYKKLQEQAREMHPKKKRDTDEEAKSETETSDSEEFEEKMATIEMKEYLKDLQQSSSFQDVYAMMPIQVKENVADDIQDDYDDAQNHIAAKLARKPEVYLAEPMFKEKNFKDKQVERAYMTIHSGSHPAMKSPFRKRMSEAFDAMNLDTYNNVNEKSPMTPKGRFSPGSLMYRRRKEPKVKFQVTKVDDVITEIP